MTLKDNQIVTVSLMVSEEQILAMGGINLLPILQCQFYRRKRRMGMEFIFKSVPLKELKNLIYSSVTCHLLRLFA